MGFLDLLPVATKQAFQTTKATLRKLPLLGGLTPEQITTGRKLLGQIERPIAGLRAVSKEGFPAFGKGFRKPELYPVGTFAESLVEAGMEPVSAGALGSLADVGYYFGLPEAVGRVVTAGKVGLLNKAIKNVSEVLKESRGLEIKLKPGIAKAVARDKDVSSIIDMYVKSKKFRLPKQRLLKPPKPTALQPKAGGLPAREVPPIVQKKLDKGINITRRDAPIRMEKDMTVKDVSGNKVTLPEGEEYTPFVLSNNQVWLHDGKNILVNKNQMQNVEQQGTVLGKKAVRPEEVGLEEVWKGIRVEKLPNNYSYTNATKQSVIDVYKQGQPTTEISRRTGIGETTILNWVRQSGDIRTAFEARGIPKDVIENIKKEYKTGKSTWKIAEEMGMARSTVHGLLQKEDLTRPIGYRYVEPDIKQKAIELYASGELNRKDIANQLNVSESAVRAWANEAGIKRDLSEAQSLRAATGRLNNYGIKVKFKSPDTGKVHIADSSYELARMRQLEALEDVMSVETSKDRIPYAGGRSKYNPDLLIKTKDGRVIVEEIKPIHKLSEPKVIEKADAAKKFYAEKNIEYRVITETDIGIEGFNDNILKDLDISETDKTRIRGSFKNAREYLRKARLGYDQPMAGGLPIKKPAKKPSFSNEEIAAMSKPELQAIIKEKLAGAKSNLHRQRIIQKYAQPKKLNFENPAFEQHVAYFKQRQLPVSSKIRGIQAKMAQARGQRLSGKIAPAVANSKIRSLKRQLFKAAKDEGISVRMTKGGRVELSLRKAGTYVPTEFSEYPNFKNVGMVMGGGTDITRAIQSIDGNLTVKQKAIMPGQAGVVERFVLFPTRDITIQKINWVHRIAELRNSIVGNIKPDSPQDKDITRAMKNMSSTPEAKEIAVKLRQLYDDMIYAQNFMRALRGQDLIRYRFDYSPEQLRDATIWEQVFGVGKTPKDIIASAELPDYIHPNKPFNPRELANRHGIPFEEQEPSAVKLLDNYMATASKDIFNTSIIQNNKAFIQQLKTLGKDRAATLLEAWTSEGYGGIKTKLIKYENLPVKIEGAMRKFNQLRNMGIFAFNYSWSIFTQTSSFALTVGRYGAENATKGLYRYLSDSGLREDIAATYYSYIVKSHKAGNISSQDTENILGKPVKQYKSWKNVVEDVGYWMIETMEKVLTGASIEAARLDGIQRGLTGDALTQYASDGGAKTQSMYNDEDKPRVLRSLIVKTGIPFQTFNFEVMNTLKEWAGKSGTPPDSKIQAIWQIVRFLATASVFSALAWKGARRRVWFDVTRLPIPFSEMWLSPITGVLWGEFSQSQGLTSPVQTGVNIGRGIKDIVDYGNWDKLRRETIRYGSGMLGVSGGTQWSRIVDAWIAFARGGVYDKTGKQKFELTDPWDAVRAGFSGVYSTTGGTRYLKTKRVKSKEQKKIQSVSRRATLYRNRFKELWAQGKKGKAEQVWAEWSKRYAKRYRVEYGKRLEKPTYKNIQGMKRRRKKRGRLTPEERSRRALPGKTIRKTVFPKPAPKSNNALRRFIPK